MATDREVLTYRELRVGRTYEWSTDPSVASKDNRFAWRRVVLLEKNWHGSADATTNIVLETEDTKERFRVLTILWHLKCGHLRNVK